MTQLRSARFFRIKIKNVYASIIKYFEQSRFWDYDPFRPMFRLSRPSITIIFSSHRLLIMLIIENQNRRTKPRFDGTLRCAQLKKKSAFRFTVALSLARLSPLTFIISTGKKISRKSFQLATFINQSARKLKGSSTTPYV